MNIIYNNKLIEISTDRRHYHNRVLLAIQGERTRAPNPTRRNFQLNEQTNKQCKPTQHRHEGNGPINLRFCIIFC